MAKEDQVGAVSPVPERLIVCGDAFEAICNEPERDPEAVGENVTATVQLASDPKESGQLLVWEKSPVTEKEAELMTVVPELSSVTT